MTPAALAIIGGTGTFSVTTQPECAWTASTAVNWISNLSPSSGQGTRDVEFRVAANDGSAVREADIVVNDSRVIPARLVGYRVATGGKWEGLYLGTKRVPQIEGCSHVEF